MSTLPRLGLGLRNGLGAAKIRTMATGTPPGFKRWPLLVSPAELRNLPKEVSTQRSERSERSCSAPLSVSPLY